jgi:hypothetical protein
MPNLTNSSTPEEGNSAPREIISREEALARGLRMYFTGKPCVQGHIAERYTKSHNCRECSRERNNQPEHRLAVKRWRAKNPDKFKAIQRRRWYKNAEKYRATRERYYAEHREEMLAKARKAKEKARAAKALALETKKKIKRPKRRKRKRLIVPAPPKLPEGW